MTEVSFLTVAEKGAGGMEEEAARVAAETLVAKLVRGTCNIPEKKGGRRSVSSIDSSK